MKQVADFSLITSNQKSTLSQKSSWLIPGVLPEGLSLLLGKFKVGKSWLALLFCIELAKTTGKPIFYFALEDCIGKIKARLKVLLQSLNIEALNNLYFYFECPRLDRGGKEEIDKLCSLYKPLLIVIDPWVMIKPIICSSYRTDSYLADYQSLTYFKNLTEKGINVLLVYHKIKAKFTDPLDKVLEIPEVVDNILSLEKQEGTKTCALEVIAKDYEKKSWVLSFEDGEWTILGNASEVMLAKEQRRILEAIKELGGEASIKEIAIFLNKNYSTVRTIITRMQKKGVLKKVQKGRYSFLCSNYSNCSKSSNCGSFAIFAIPYSKNCSNFYVLPNLVKNENGLLDDLNEEVGKEVRIG
jgi:RecA-family ATPase